MHNLLFALSLAAQVQDSLRTDTVKHVATPASIASAFADPAARELFGRARTTRLSQDSALVSYDAKVRQRLSVRASIGRFGPERLVYRNESAARVQWQRGTGARIEMTGARVAIPIVGSSDVERDEIRDIITEREMSPVPYFPGSETMLIGAGLARADIDVRKFIHPLANGAETFYTYAVGDSATFRLPTGQALRIRELKVRPRMARPNLAVGSLWFDASSGYLVRATYRLAAPTRAGVGVSSDDSTVKVPKLTQFIVKALVGPGSAQISGVVVEYGLYQGKFWLPRLQSMQGFVEITFARVPVTYESSFEYESVNQDLRLAAIHVDTMSRGLAPRLGRPPAGLDSAARRRWRDSATVVYEAARKARADSTRAGLSVGSMRQCDSSGTRVITEYRFDAKIPVELRIPCDLERLANSADLPASIYDAGEEIFGAADRDRAIADALSMSAQAPLFGALPAPQFQFGLSLTRFNRVEGFSTGIGVEQEIGGGYSLSALGRFGASDRIPNGELSLARANASATTRLTGYSRLVSASDWGNPLSFGSSLSSLLFGRDEGFYYRAAGAELLWASERGVRLEWRAFVDHQRSARQTRTSSLGSAFVANIDASEGAFAGASVRLLRDFGANPFGFRAFTDLRLEAARGDSLHGRAALDVTISKAWTQQFAAALTVAGGSSAGAVPVQRRWFLGGTQTIRGQRPDTAQSGNAFWFSRLELAKPGDGHRVSLFGDIGWAGNRARMGDVGRPMSGVGIGLSGFDGLIRVDLARGVYPRKQTRVNLYLDARF